MAKLVHYFKNADMRCNHPGLTKTALRAKINPETLSAGEFILFVNARQTMFKLLGPNNTLVHVRSNHGRVDLRTVAHVPDNFNGENFSYTAALKKVLERDLKRGDA